MKEKEMTLVETVIVMILASSPFGSIPFAVSEHGKDVQVEFMTNPPTQIVLNKDMEVIEVNHEEKTCEVEL